MATVLVVDDDQFDRSLIVRNLMRVLPDADIVEVSDSGKAVQVFQDKKPKLAVLDIRMPAPDGFDVLSEIRANPEYDGCSVIMLSGSTSANDVQRSRNLGANDYEVKPDSLGGYRELAEKLASNWL
ncbi:response regulator [Oricola cellulosilytica]|uniref:Response regulator n=1 Tax=Oricola cellulosilytica TaxID=1429082 RepID=A0A4R0PFJ1_9HYPH|nr:response regulator [Oricola cellulosilytica]TCD16606.1 response regulator [Oricola cellulosilytica]